MLDLPKVSVIVPVYNVENYLEECLDSLVNQTLIDFEIICIDDGSTDRSLEILRQYESQYPNFRIFTQNNNGPSRARNVGLDNALGEYIYFMDSDDILSKFALKNLYTIAKAKSLDLIIFKLMNFNDETGEKFSTDYYDMKFLKETVGDSVFSHRDLDSNYIFKIAVSPPAKFYRREILDDLRFPEGYLFEDNPFFVESFFRCERVYFHDKYLYYRRIRNNSITTSTNRTYMDYIPISEMMIDIAKRYGVYEDYREGLYAKTIGNIFFRFTEVGEEVKDEFFHKIQDDFNSKKEEYDSDEVFQNSPERIRKIFYEGIDSQTYKEYELSINVLDLNTELEKQKVRYEQRIDNYRDKVDRLNGDISDKRKEIKSLKKEINTNKKEIKRLNNKIDSLTKSNESLRKVNDELMNSTSWKVTKPLRKAGRVVKK